ncbi:hypothetical protein K8R33_05065 [archaeon]|nr:hypothetical protein [archaeon]
MDHKLHKKKTIQHMLTLIFIIILAPFIILLDLFVEIYHQIGFRLCNIPLVKRKAYILIDRHKLQYLNWFDKLACTYCGYANGFARYIVEIGARTEKYWCAIKHKKTSGFHDQPHQKKFLEYGDKKTYKKKYH